MLVLDNTTDEYKTQVYYATIYAIVEEMDKRFSELNLSFLKSLEALIPNFGSFLSSNVLKHFLDHNIGEAAIMAEVSTVNIFLDERDPLFLIAQCLPATVKGTRVLPNSDTMLSDSHDHWYQQCCSRKKVLFP
uniref:Uncharacterized protein n=1 Tax=Amphimedon queenslandica TaxID=400682 RepID=A0A1X7U6C4_AMPQE